MILKLFESIVYLPKCKLCVNMKNIIYTLAILFIFSTMALGAGGESAMPFLRISPSARQIGMGESFVGIADDVNAVSLFDVLALCITKL